MILLLYLALMIWVGMGGNVFPARPLYRDDFDLWPYSTGLLIKMSAFLGYFALAF